MGNLHGSLFPAFNANMIEANIGYLLLFAIVGAVISWRKDAKKRCSWSTMVHRAGAREHSAPKPPQ
jgi:hypothetical protein